MAVSKILKKRSGLIRKSLSCYGNGVAGLHSFTIEAVPGYKPIGIVGYMAVGGYEATRGIYEFDIRPDDSTLVIGWENAVPSNRGITVIIIYLPD